MAFGESSNCTYSNIECIGTVDLVRAETSGASCNLSVARESLSITGSRLLEPQLCDCIEPCRYNLHIHELVPAPSILQVVCPERRIAMHGCGQASW